MLIPLASQSARMVIAASPVAFTTLKVCGGLYLIWLGIQALRSRGGSRAKTVEGPAETLPRLFVKGLFANAINPKVVLFFLSFLPQFVVPARGHVALQTAALGVTFTAQAAVLFGLLGYFSGHIGQWLQRSARASAWLDRVAGSVFVALGLLCGAAAPQFLRLMDFSKASFRKLPVPLPIRLALGGLVVGILSVWTPEVWGNGYSVVNSVLHSPWTWVVEGKLVGGDELRAAAIASGRFDYDAPLEGLRAVDRYTLRFRFRNPNYLFQHWLTYVSLAAVAREVVLAHQDESHRVMEHPVGTGAYPWRLMSVM